MYLLNKLYKSLILPSKSSDEYNPGYLSFAVITIAIDSDSVIRNHQFNMSLYIPDLQLKAYKT